MQVVADSNLLTQSGKNEGDNKEQPDICESMGDGDVQDGVSLLYRVAEDERYH